MVMMLSTEQRRCGHAVWQRHVVVGVARSHRHFGNSFVNNFCNVKDWLSHTSFPLLFNHMEFVINTARNQFNFIAYADMRQYCGSIHMEGSTFYKHKI